MEFEHPDAKPWERPIEPDHPMVVEGDVIPGDTAFMFRCLVEELLRVGIGPAELREMSHDSNYQALRAARVAMGDRAVDRIIEEAAAATGTHRVRSWEATGTTAPASLTIGASGRCGKAAKEGE